MAVLAFILKLMKKRPSLPTNHPENATDREPETGDMSILNLRGRTNTLILLTLLGLSACATADKKSLFKQSMDILSMANTTDNPGERREVLNDILKLHLDRLEELNEQMEEEGGGSDRATLMEAKSICETIGKIFAEQKEMDEAGGINYYTKAARFGEIIAGDNPDDPWDIQETARLYRLANKENEAQKWEAAALNIYRQKAIDSETKARQEHGNMAKEYFEDAVRFYGYAGDNAKVRETWEKAASHAEAEQDYNIAFYFYMKLENWDACEKIADQQATVNQVSAYGLYSKLLDSDLFIRYTPQQPGLWARISEKRRKLK